MRRLRLSPNRGMNLALVWLVHRPCGRQQWQRHKQNIPHPMECGLPTRCAANHHSIPSTPPSIATLARNHLPSPRAAPRDDEWGELQGQDEKDDDDDDDDDRLHSHHHPCTYKATDDNPRPDAPSKYKAGGDQTAEPGPQFQAGGVQEAKSCPQFQAEP